MNKIVGILLTTILLSLTFLSCKEDEVENDSLTSYWISGSFRDSDHVYKLWIKNDSLFSFEMNYRVYDGIDWNEVSGTKIYTGRYHTDGKKLVLMSDSMFLLKDQNAYTYDTIAINQQIFKDCEYSIKGGELRIDYTIVHEPPFTEQRTMYFYHLEY